MYTSFGPKEKFGLSYLGQATAAASTAFPLLVSVCHIFVCLDNGMVAGVGVL